MDYYIDGEPDSRFQPDPPRRSRDLLLWAGIALVLLIAGAAIGWAPAVTEQVRAWTSPADSATRKLADAAGMTSTGQRLFLGADPSIEPASTFDKACADADSGTGAESGGHSGGEGAQTLGCFVPSSGIIHIRDLSALGPSGANLETVTAAHEMLHVAWERTGRAERERLTALLEAEAVKRADDPSFTGMLAPYGDISAPARDDELHSLVGTETAGLSPELEEHYARYFLDRAALVDLSAAPTR
ncbi:hypothetical protein [Glaciibacter flavus]|uniref:hypothetical protein n=1 Tax=Orlajensenia flava TaxID=2565934 RepID=UPI003B0083C4